LDLTTELWQEGRIMNEQNNYIPPRPPKSFRITLDLVRSQNRLDTVLLAAMKSQKENLNVSNISRTGFKKLFQDRQILIKGQPARPSSSLAKGMTYVDILGF
jgi:hypothetical protein